nr:immunoglobulin light chain junction region [Macaca mulatta]MOW35638.1 immunoglobulin light chain junction region [Macaca mulatta]MOW42148.1 immunoglobulin light chain junction region [Macaca mulatta]MOW42378.1 immunoglobulin light chain junction region [Macaca mulatta]MOW43349.1 immunoglobulin light chain junction region [Macaca mulatta]
CQHGYGILFTF